MAFSRDRGACSRDRGSLHSSVELSGFSYKTKEVELAAAQIRPDNGEATSCR